MSENNSDNSAQRRMISQTQEYVQEIRDRFWQEGVDGGFSPRTKRMLAAGIMRYWDVLYQYRDESVLKDGDFPDISPVRSRIGERTEIVTKSKRLGQDTTVKTVPAIAEVSDWYLLGLTKELDDCANKLGFSAEVSSGTHRVEISDELVEEVEKWRQQNLD